MRFEKAKIGFRRGLKGHSGELRRARAQAKTCARGDDPIVQKPLVFVGSLRSKAPDRCKGFR
jgi:hypothetical protein